MGDSVVSRGEDMPPPIVAGPGTAEGWGAPEDAPILEIGTAVRFEVAAGVVRRRCGGGPLLEPDRPRVAGRLRIVPADAVGPEPDSEAALFDRDR